MIQERFQISLPISIPLGAVKSAAPESGFEVAAEFQFLSVRLKVFLP